MTFDATSPKMKLARAVGLVCHTPLRPVDDPVRCILCPPCIEELLNRQVETLDFPALGVAIILGKFISGFHLVISRKKTIGSRRNIELEKLEDFDEVWALCFRKPKPGWRLLGRFLDKDTFVILKILHKNDIGGDYGETANIVIQKWEEYFRYSPPFRGCDVSDYLSGLWSDSHHEKE